MDNRIFVSLKNASNYFHFEKLSTASLGLEDFCCPIPEYNEYLITDAARSRKDHIALTWLLRDNRQKKIASYMSLITDSIKISTTEKELHFLNYPFKMIPALKVAKLAVDENFSKKYKGIGTYMIEFAAFIARSCDKIHAACRFLSVDADIEHNKTVLVFYEKNGFLKNEELYNKNRKVISMRKDIYG
ncbi:MAG: GNAT family N-acetyltransferase [Fibromonadales bacterium]|nr:GNAT family N-acetyltransferase [Fibromonadales bacterium]